MKIQLTASFEIDINQENRAIATRIQDDFRRKIYEFRDSSDPLIADGKSEPYRMGVLKLFFVQNEGE